MRLDIALASAALAVASTGSFVSADIHHELSGRDDFGKGLGFKVQHARQAGPPGPRAADRVITPNMAVDPDQADHRLNQGAQGDKGSPKPKDAKPKPQDANPPGNFPTAPDGLAFSPPFYPTPQANGSKGKWGAAIAKAKKTVAGLSTEDKVKLTTGTGWASDRCVGNISPNISGIPGWKGLCLEDSPLGVRFADLVTVFPSGLTTAATWSSKMTFDRGVAMGEEFKAKGVNLQLGPGMNMHRSPAAGRNWEMAGADPYQVGESAYQTTLGIQSAGVQAVAKHYLLNEQEHFRETSSSNADDRTIREIYEHPFLRAVQADVASVMCSYNLANNSWAGQNSDLLNRRLKKDMGFQGFVMSDWGATHSGVGAANAGLDMTMPGDIFCCFPGQTTSYFGGNLTTAVNNGSVASTRLDDMATRILGGWYLLGQDQNYPAVNFDAFKSMSAPTNEHVNAMRPSHAAISRKISASGTVILKNDKNVLPFNKPGRVALIGSDAGPAEKGANFYADRGGVDGTLGIGWGSGTADYSYLISPYEAISARTKQDGTDLHWSFDDYDYNTAQKLAAAADVAMVFLQSDSGEGYITVDGNAGDRNNLTAWHDGDTLVKQVAAVNNNTVVVMHAPGQVDIEQWADHPNVTAIVWAGMPGSESGSGLVDVLYDGHEGGRLPFTMAKQRSDYGADVVYESSDTIPQIPYTEKLNIDYRHFDAENITPRYEFGYGLSFTSWKYKNARGKWIGPKNVDKDVAKSKPGEVYPDELFTPVYEISFDVQNSGGRDGAAIPQVYLGFPADSGEPPKVLRKFSRHRLAKGMTRTVTYQLSTYDLSVWNVVAQRWEQPKGKTTVYIGNSSRDIRAQFTL